MWNSDTIFLGASRKPDDSYQKAEELLLKYGNRHGLVTGATGTGKTVTLQVLAEGFSNAGVPVFCADVKVTSPAWRRRRAEGFPSQARRGSEARALRVLGIPRDLLGPLRREGPSDPGHRVGDGAAAPVAAHEPLRGAGRRDQHRLQDRRRGRTAPPRHEGPAVHPRQHGGTRQRDRRALRQCDETVGRCDPALAARARAAGRQQLLRRARSQDRRHHADGARRARGHQRAGRRQADDEPAALRDLPALAAFGAFRGAPEVGDPTSRSSSSSSTRHICCSTRRRRSSSTASNRSSG